MKWCQIPVNIFSSWNLIYKVLIKGSWLKRRIFDAELAVREINSWRYFSEHKIRQVGRSPRQVKTGDCREAVEWGEQKGQNAGRHPAHQVSSKLGALRVWKYLDFVMLLSIFEKIFPVKQGKWCAAKSI